MPLTSARNTPRRDGKLISLPMGANATVYAGGMVSVLANDTGAVRTGTASSGRAVGVAQETVVNGAVAGEKRVTVEAGCWRFGNSADADAIALGDIGSIAYAVDDATVALTDGGATRVIAGAIVDVDAQGVWVEIGPSAVGPQGPQGEQGEPG